MEKPPLTYTFNPRPFGAGNVYTLREDGLGFASGLRSRVLPYNEITSIRLAFAPKNFNAGGFSATVASGWRKVTIANVSWKGLMEQDTDNPGYRAFVSALVGEAVRANPSVVLAAGVSAWRYWGMVPLTAVMLGMLAWFCWRSLGQGVWPAALIGLAMGAYLAWWSKRFIERNRPGAFTAGNIPERVLPLA